MYMNICMILQMIVDWRNVFIWLVYLYLKLMVVIIKRVDFHYVPLMSFQTQHSNYFFLKPSHCLWRVGDQFCTSVAHLHNKDLSWILQMVEVTLIHMLKRKISCLLFFLKLWWASWEIDSHKRHTNAINSFQKLMLVSLSQWEFLLCWSKSLMT